MNSYIVYLNHQFQVVRNKYKRSLTIKLSLNKGNKIIINESVSSKRVYDFLSLKHDWLLKHLTIQDTEKNECITPEFKEGQFFPFLGEMKYLIFEKSDNKNIFFKVEDGFLIFNSPDSFEKISNEKLHKKLVSFYKDEARKYLIQRCLDLSKEYNLYPSEIKIQTARSRWGSCNSKKIINLNWKLMALSKMQIDYVITHELCHLVYMNHSKDFWSQVDELFPNYKEIQNSFKKNSFKTVAFLERN